MGMGNGTVVCVWGSFAAHTDTHTETIPHRRCDYGVFVTINCPFLTSTALNIRFGTLLFVRSIDVGADTHTRVPGTRFKGYY